MTNSVFLPTGINNLTDNSLKNRIKETEDNKDNSVVVTNEDNNPSLEDMYNEIKQIHHIWLKEKQQIKTVLDEFKELIEKQDTLITEGIHFSRKILDKAEYRLEESQTTIPESTFDIVKKMETCHLVNFIQLEQPQTIALILAYLEPEKASIILECLQDEIKPEVIKRISTLDRTSNETLSRIERVLEKKIAKLSNENYTTVGGIGKSVKILNLVDRSSKKAIIESLEEDDPDLAEEIKYRMFVFEDIVILDDHALQKVMSEVDTQELVKALKSVDTEVQDKFFRNMSKRAVAMLKEDIKLMGPIRIKDVEESQRKIVSIIKQLEDSGEIIIDRTCKK